MGNVSYAVFAGGCFWCMVAPFEEAAFSLPIGQVSEPVKSDFGYHLIEVIEKDTQRPKDEAKLKQVRETLLKTINEG